MATGEPRPDTKSAICHAARACFAEKGVTGTSVADIIARSGLSAGAIYHHFASKHDVVVEVARMSVVQALADVREFDPAGPVSPRVLFESAAAGLLKHPEGSKLLVQLWAAAALDPGLTALLDAHMRLLRDGVTARLGAWRVGRGGVPDEAADENLTQLLVGLCVGFLTQHALLGPAFDISGYIELVGRLLDAYTPGQGFTAG